MKQNELQIDANGVLDEMGVIIANQAKEIAVLKTQLRELKEMKFIENKENKNNKRSG